MPRKPAPPPVVSPSLADDEVCARLDVDAAGLRALIRDYSLVRGSDGRITEYAVAAYERWRDQRKAAP
jgi:hypothetical protein